MHFPVFIHVGPFTLPPHPVFESLGCFIGARLYFLMRKRYSNIPIDKGVWILVGALVGSAVGSKVLAWFENPHVLLLHIHDKAYLMSGETIVGGLLGGLLGVELAKKCVGWRASTGDAFVAPLIIGISIGRVGCFLAGLPDGTYGTETRWFTGVNFGDGIPRHPTQLYEIGFLLLFGCVLWLLSKSKFRRLAVPGTYFQLFMTGYLVFRLAVEFIKPTPHIYFGLSNIQLACAMGLAYYLPKLWSSLAAQYRLLSGVEHA